MDGIDKNPVVHDDGHVKIIGHLLSKGGIVTRGNKMGCVINGLPVRGHHVIGIWVLHLQAAPGVIVIVITISAGHADDAIANLGLPKHSVERVHTGRVCF